VNNLKIKKKPRVVDDSVTLFTARLMAFFDEVCTSEWLLKEVSLAVDEPGELMIFFLKTSRVSLCGL